MEIWENLSLEDMEGEVWKDIEGYEGIYQVSNMGRVKSLNYNHTKKPRILKQSVNGRGYPQLNLYKGPIRKIKTVHTLVAKAFIPNPENKYTVDHINTVRHDNKLENLRWATLKENMNNEITKKRFKEIQRETGKRTIVIARKACEKKVKCTTTGRTFNSIKEASEYYSVNRTLISNCCRGARKTGGKLPDGTKLEWEYIDKN